MSLDASNGSSGTTTTAPASSSRPTDLQIVDLLKGKKPAANAAGQAEGTDGASPRSASKPGGGEASSPPPAAEKIFDDDAPPEADDEAKLSKSEARRLKEFAKEHGISAKALYDMVVDIDGSEPVSVGTLKDRWQETAHYQSERDAFDLDRMAAQNEISQARAQMQGMVERMTQVLPPATMARMFSDVIENAERQAAQAKAQLMEWYPQWADHAVLQRDRDRIVTWAEKRGFSRHEVEHIMDARLVKVVMDFMKTEEILTRLRDGGEREVKPSTAPPSRTRHRPSSFEQAKSIAASGDKIGGIAKLLEGSKR